MRSVSILLCLIAFNACSSRQERGGDIQVSLSATSVPEFEVGKVVRLATRDDALVGKSYSLKITRRYYVAGDRSKIIVFTKSGEIHAVISATGTGPREVAGMDFFHADDRSIMVMDMWKHRILEFDFDGQYLKTTDLANGYAEFVRYGDGYLFDFQQRATMAGNVLIFADANGTETGDAIPVIGKGINYGSGKFQSDGTGGWLYLPSFSNTVYKIDGNAARPLYTFDFGIHGIDRETCDRFVDDRSGDPFALWKYMKKNDKAGFLKFTDASGWIVLNFEKRDKVYNWFYNRASGKQYTVEYEENQKNSLLKYGVTGNEDGEFVTLIPAFAYAQLPGLPELAVSDEDNPVLVCYRLK